ncbi:MAG: VanZ family protein [Patescibacteria group bacterium]
MYKRLTALFLFIAYSLILIKVMVLKDVPLIKVGMVKLNFGGTTTDNPANFIPFKTILPYLFGHRGLVIAGINLVGNIILLVPLGFLIPLIYKNITWKKSFLIAAASGLIIEVLQVLLQVGIFDIDDVILNAFGFMIGYWIYCVLAKIMRFLNPKNRIIIAVLILGIAGAVVFYGYQKLQLGFEPGVRSSEESTTNQRDLCNGTGGNGKIISVGDTTFTLELKNGKKQIVYLTDKTKIKISSGDGSISDLKIGVRVTLVGDVNNDGGFAADSVYVCN